MALQERNSCSDAGKSDAPRDEGVKLPPSLDCFCFYMRALGMILNLGKGRSLSRIDYSDKAPSKPPLIWESLSEAWFADSSEATYSRYDASFELILID